MTNLLEIRDLAFAYCGRAPVLDGVSLTLAPSEKLGLAGENGSGKTTLLRLVSGLEKPARGTISYRGAALRCEADFRASRPKLGYVLQDAREQLFFPEVIDDVAFGPLNLGKSQEEARRDATEALEMLGIGHLRDQLGVRLSGGERKLVAIASVLSMKPEALLLDEPTNALDARARARIVEILAGLPVAAIVVSHDAELLRATCTRFVRLASGRLEDASPSEL